MSKETRRRRRWPWLVLVVLVGLQLVPVDREPPPSGTEVEASAEVRAVLERACFDCHSHRTAWPWYAWVSPISLWIAHDVEEGREHLNFSTWERYDAAEARHARVETWEEVEEGEMPPWYYVLLHPEAELSPADREVLKAWSTSED